MANITSVPSVEACFMPLLLELKDEQPLLESSLFPNVRANHFSTLPSIALISMDRKGVPLIQRRMAWALFYLIAAGFIQHRSRHFIQLTAAGAQIIKAHSCTWKTLTETPAWTQKFGAGWLPPQAV